MKPCEKKLDKLFRYLHLYNKIYLMYPITSNLDKMVYKETFYNLLTWTQENTKTIAKIFAKNLFEGSGSRPTFWRNTLATSRCVWMA